MIDRNSRDRLAAALRHYVSGQITNDELDSVDVDWRDRGAVAVKQMAWQLYDDTRQHRVDGRFPRSSDDRAMVVRWIAFLYSNREYLWPEYTFVQIVNWPMNLATLGWWERMKRRKWEQFLEAGDFSAWPFCSRRELEEVRRAPRLLARGNATREDRGSTLG